MSAEALPFYPSDFVGPVLNARYSQILKNQFNFLLVYQKTNYEIELKNNLLQTPHWPLK